MRSLVFDQAADYYDRSRAIGASALGAIARQAAVEVRHRGKCLDVGIGTGRIAIALKNHGIDMVGVDLSMPMLRQLRLKNQEQPIPAALVDAVSLAFADKTFGSGIGCFVLNLVPNWRKAVTEMVRVVRPGGVLLFMLAGAQGITREINDYFFAQAGDNGYPFGLKEPHDLDEHARALGLHCRLLSPIADWKRVTVSERIRALELGVYAGCWSLRPKTRQRAAHATRRWASERFGHLHYQWSDPETFAWRVYDVPL